MDKLHRAAGRAILQALKVRRRESVLLVTDEPKLEIAKALAFWARRAGAETTTYLMPEELRPITEPTRLLQSLVEKAACIIYTLETRLEEKPFRGYLVKTGRKSGRILMMPGINREMMERLIDIDYEKLHRFTKKVIRSLRGAASVEVENPQGTALRFSVKARRWVASCGDISRRGGLVLSLIDDRLGRGVLEFERGRLTAWKGKGVEAVLRTIGDDETGKIIGEFGIGTNRKARLSANMLEAEKAFGTAHFAIGDSYGLGRNSSRHHYDALVEKVTVRADGRMIIKNGRFCI
jgi:leucyl aminopeptidase (aminopeptidase T)